MFHVQPNILSKIMHDGLQYILYTVQFIVTINCIRNKICKIVNQNYRFLALRYD